MYIENFKFPTTFAFPLGSNLKIPVKHLGAGNPILALQRKIATFADYKRKVSTKIISMEKENNPIYERNTLEFVTVALEILYVCRERRQYRSFRLSG